MPQLENGYATIANELLDAICRTRLPGEAMQVFHVIIRMTYGWSRKKWTNEGGVFEKLTGLDKHRISRAIRRLIDLNMITRTGKTFSINKHYKQWIKVVKTGNKKVVKTGNKSKKKDAPLVVKTGNKKLSNLVTSGTFIHLYLRKQIKQKTKRVSEPIKIPLMKGKNGSVIVGLTETEHDRLIKKYGDEDTKLMIVTFREKYATLWKKNQYKSAYKAMQVWHRNRYFSWQKDTNLRSGLLMANIIKRENEVKREKIVEAKEVEQGPSLDEIMKMKARCKACQSTKVTPSGCDNLECPDFNNEEVST